MDGLVCALPSTLYLAVIFNVIDFGIISQFAKTQTIQKRRLSDDNQYLRFLLRQLNGGY